MVKIYTQVQTFTPSLPLQYSVSKHLHLLKASPVMLLMLYCTHVTLYHLYLGENCNTSSSSVANGSLLYPHEWRGNLTVYERHNKGEVCYFFTYKVLQLLTLDPPTSLITEHVPWLVTGN